MTKIAHGELRRKALNVLEEYNRFVFGYEDIGAKMLIAAIAGRVCHILTEGVPGLAKTHSVKTMSRCISDTTATRIQFTPDMMPKEITGSKVRDLDTRQSYIDWGKIVDVNFLVADEINRGKSTTQSALLEAMGEGQVTVAGETRRVQNPFVAMATQNPIEQEGTNPLPEAQHDRFLFKLLFDYAGWDDEMLILEHPELADPTIYDKIVPQMSKEELLAIREIIGNEIHVSRIFNEYLLKVCRTTRPDKPEFEDFCRKHPELAPTMKMVKVGVGPRALQGLQRACRVQAFLFGQTEEGASRDYVMPADLKALAKAVLRHRIIMKEEAAYTKGGAITSDKVIDAVLEHIFPNDDVESYKKRS